MAKNYVQLVLVCERGGRAIPLARIADATLVASAARSAIAAAAARADEIAKADAVLGTIERAEAHRLSEVLGALLPGVCSIKRLMQRLSRTSGTFISVGMGFGVWVVPHADLQTNVESIRSIVAFRSAAVERLALGIVDILLAYGAFDEYWLSLPFAQSELEGGDFIKGRRVSHAALLEIADAVAACVSECLRGGNGRRAA